jgi:diadenosine tetraphosphatase ApaH/serine/threonine PP2A family protein phosphatase
MFDNTDETGEGPLPHLLAYGDIHAAFIRCFQHRTLVNVGSVGNPLDIPLACYALLEVDTDAISPGLLTASLVRVPYDIEQAIRDAEAAAMPVLAAYAGELRTARYRHAAMPA